VASEKLVEKLSAFGLSHNQAKVYASIVRSGNSGIDQISEQTGIHPQDIYKISKKLEEKGLATRTFSKPLIIEAIPVEIGLRQLLFSEKQRITENVRRLEVCYSEMRKISAEGKKSDGKIGKPSHFFLLQGNGAATWRKVDLAFDRLRQEYDLLLPSEPFPLPQLDYTETVFKKLARRKGIKVRLLTIVKDGKLAKPSSSEKDPSSTVANVIKSAIPKSVDFELRVLEGESKVYFAMIDLREVWFPIMLGDRSVVLVTDSEELVTLAKQEFETLWNSSKTKTVAKSKPAFKNISKGVREKGLTQIPLNPN